MKYILMYKLFIFLETINANDDKNITETLEKQLNKMGIYIGIILFISLILLYLSILSIAKLNAIKRKYDKLKESIENKSNNQ